MKKRISALVLCVLLVLTALPTVHAAFDDITDPQVSLAATTLRGLGIVTGTSANSFTPNNSLSRAEACTLIINTMGLSNQVNTYKQRTIFSDVLPNNWYTGIVNLAYAQGIVNGYGNGTFGPNDKVTYGHFATMLLRLLGYSGEQIGSVWPLDYTAFCDNLEISTGLNLTPNQVLTRGQAAVLLYRALNTLPGNGKNPYYTTLSSVATTRQAILLDNNVSYGGADGLLMVYGLDNGSGLDYYEQTTTLDAALSGSIVTLLLDDRGDVMAAIPESGESRDVVIRSAKASGITGEDGVTRRISSNAVTIVGDSSYTWGSTGYVQINSRAGQTARLFYEDGAVTYVCLTAGTAAVGAQIAVAQTDSAAGELTRKLNVTGSYSIIKNGALAQAGDLARYDTAYYDKVTNTLCVSDYQLSGYIQSAEPSLDAAKTVTVAGCTVSVLEAAWDTLGDYKMGDFVTLLLTDDCKVAAAVSDAKVSREMVGVLGTDGRSITLCDSGLKISAQEVEVDAKLKGMLVRANTNIGQNKIICSAYTGDGKANTLNLTERTMGSYKLAPSCAVYEQAGSSYLYSLSGEQGVASYSFDEIFWTDTIAAGKVGTVRLNRAGQVDLVVLKDVTGNIYKYGKLTRYTGEDGILTQSSPSRIYNSAVTMTNGEGQSQKYLSAYAVSTYNSYYGIVLSATDGSYQQATSVVKLTQVQKVTADAFFLNADRWYVLADGREVPVSEQVQVYFESTGQWFSGEDGLRAALANGTAMDVHYDRTLNTGAQVRVIQVNE